MNYYTIATATLNYSRQLSFLFTQYTLS